MLRGMVFVDYLNFYVATRKLYGNQDAYINYSTVFSCIYRESEYYAQTDHLKTFLFAPKPDDFLMEMETWQKYYRWLLSLKETNYFDIIEGRYLSHPTDFSVPKDPEIRNTYYLEEKGTDVNLAANLISLAHYNSYDIAFVVSGDSDYLGTYQKVSTMGKLIVNVLIGNQRNETVKPYIDETISLDKEYFDNHTT